MTTLPPNYLRLSSKWLETNVAPKDLMYATNRHPQLGWNLSRYAGDTIPIPLFSFNAYATARTDLPREAYADDEIRSMTAEECKALDEFTMKELRSEPGVDLTQPGAEVASERAEAFTIHSIDGGTSESFEYVTVDDARRLESTIATLRAEIAELKAAIVIAVQQVSAKQNGFLLCAHDLEQRGRPEEAKEWKHRSSGMDEVLMILAEQFPQISELEPWR